MTITKCDKCGQTITHRNKIKLTVREFNKDNLIKEIKHLTICSVCYKDFLEFMEGTYGKIHDWVKNFN